MSDKNTNNWSQHSDERDAIKKLVLFQLREKGLPGNTYGDINALVSDIIEMKHKLQPAALSRENLVKSLATTEVIFDTEQEVTESLFPLIARVHWHPARKSGNIIDIDGEVYKKYVLRKDSEDKQYTVFLRLINGRIETGQELITEKWHTFTPDEILESFLPE